MCSERPRKLQRRRLSWKPMWQRCTGETSHDQGLGFHPAFPRVCGYHSLWLALPELHIDRRADKLQRYSSPRSGDTMPCMSAGLLHTCWCCSAQGSTLRQRASTRASTALTTLQHQIAAQGFPAAPELLTPGLIGDVIRILLF